MRLPNAGRLRAPRSAVIVLALASVGSTLMSAGGARAATCAETAVSAKGEVASYKWLALVKARGNWRSKVRTIASLGGAYANYGRAEDQVERCISDQRTFVCTVTARPCRP
jgi:hypothetical protein